MYSYYNHELIVKQIQAERLHPADSRLSSEARGEIAQEAVTRHYRADRREQMEVQNTWCRMLVVNFLGAALHVIRARTPPAG